MTLRTFSYGGGWQSNAALVLAAQGKLDFDAFLFANVGADSEMPETLDYVHDIAMPYAEANGIELIEVERRWRDGRPFESIYQKILNAPEGKLREPIPVRGQNGMPLSRSCTSDWKIAATSDWVKARGASEQDKAVVALGYTLDEVARVNPDRAKPWEILTWPLIGAPAGYDTGLRLRRDDCPRIIASAGLPMPPKSHCWFCPMQRIERWHDQRRQHPERFAKAVDLELLMINRRKELGKPPVFFTRFGKPLDQVVQDGVDTLFGDESDNYCDTGGCFT